MSRSHEKERPRPRGGHAGASRDSASRKSAGEAFPPAERTARSRHPGGGGKDLPSFRLSPILRVPTAVEDEAAADPFGMGPLDAEEEVRSPDGLSDVVTSPHGSPLPCRACPLPHPAVACPPHRGRQGAARRTTAPAPPRGDRAVRTEAAVPRNPVRSALLPVVVPGAALPLFALATFVAHPIRRWFEAACGPARGGHEAGAPDAAGRGARPRRNALSDHGGGGDA